MQLYKSRDFSDFFQDTFAFLKQNGKHFFKHFFIVNGIFILILMVFGYFFTKFYSELLFGGLTNPTNSNLIEDYLNDNGPLVLILGSLFLIVAILAAVVSYAYTPIYLKLYTEKDGKKFYTKDIVDTYKQKIGSLAIYVLASILMLVVLIIPIGIIAFLLMITIVGILLLPLLIAAIALLYSSTLMEYLEGKKGIFNCFRYAWELITSKFWAAIGSVGLFFFISYIIQNIVTMIPYIFGMVSFFTTIEQQGQPDAEEVNSFMTMMMLLVFFLSFILGTILNNIVQLNQGVVFYSLKEDKENINTKSEIDLIGSGE